ncbi:MAG TPA: HAMP domain-containing sensor histidine kinase [Desulfosporosinus sp.]|nr:HAMP domain-containing sensor histidine kinase [Desulfosporosinus sp.]
MRLAKLSENLLKLTSLESEHHPFELKRYRLDNQLRKIVLAFEPQWVEKAISIKVDFEEAFIVADEELMSQVWVNLINNSLKFTPREGRISLHLQRRERDTVVQISDTGIGIHEADQAHIFERFYKADKSRNLTSSGSGLGLAIVKKILNMHDSNISVHSKNVEGTTFTVVLPSSK